MQQIGIQRKVISFGLMEVLGSPVKAYGIWANSDPVDELDFESASSFLGTELADQVVDLTMGAFLIVHRGSTMDYLVFCNWGNANECFIRVFVSSGFHQNDWRADTRYSCCVWDLEIVDLERRLFVKSFLSENKGEALDHYLSTSPDFHGNDLLVQYCVERASD